MTHLYTIVIADDEEVERKALNLLIVKEFPDIQVVGLAANGAELVSLINAHQPDIAIVDINMPAINGIDAIELIRGMEVPTRFIINTAYSDFGYAQKALKLKVDHYILKPQKRAETIQTIRTLCRSIDESHANSRSRKQMNALFSNIQPVLESEILYSVFMDEPAADSLAMWDEMHGTRFSGGVMVSAIPLSAGGRIPVDNKDSMRAFLHAALRDACVFLAAVNSAGINLLVYVPPAERGSWQGWLRDVLLVLSSQLNKSWGLALHIGVGQYYEQLGDMHKSYQESLTVLRDAAPKEVNFYSPASGSVSEDYLALLAQNLVRAATENNVARLEELLQREAPVLQQHGVAVRLWQRCREQAVAGGLPDIPETDRFFSTARNAIEHEKDPAARLGALQAGLRSLAGLVGHLETGGGQHVQRAMAIMEQRYAEDLSLEGVADEVGISPYYLSRLMRKESGCTFVEYLTRLRIKEAVRLVNASRLTIREISARVGYSNHTYFCRVFKRQTGLTIGEMREKNE